MTHVIQRRVYYHDTDCGGVVYYANYLKHMEEARTELFAAKGLDLRKLAAGGILFVVAQANLKYKAPARYNDILNISAEIKQAKTCSLKFIQEISRGNLTLVEGEITLVSVDNNFKPKPLSRDIKTNLIN
ncbi:MAG: YbgC/FadM family acyl-CoA thioesterase [Candidatus Omnitrophota bacterium]